MHQVTSFKASDVEKQNALSEVLKRFAIYFQGQDQGRYMGFANCFLIIVMLRMIKY